MQTEIFLWIPFHRASKTTNLLVLFLYIILYPHSLHLIGSLDFISFSVWHSPQIYIMGCCFGGWTSFWVSIVRPHVVGSTNSSLRFQTDCGSPSCCSPFPALVCDVSGVSAPSFPSIPGRCGGPRIEPRGKTGSFVCWVRVGVPVSLSPVFIS